MGMGATEGAGSGDDPRIRGRPVVTLERDGQLVYIHDPECLGALEALATAKLVIAPGKGGGTKLVATREPLWERANVEAYSTFLAGLEQVVHALLIAAGYSIRLVDVTCPGPTPLPPPDREAAAGLGPVDGPMLDFLHGNERGLILHGAGIDPHRLAAEAILAFPAASFAIVAAKVDDARRFHQLYRRAIPGLCWASAASCLATVGRVVVSTPYGLAHNPIGFRERDVVIALDGVETLGERGRMALQDAARGRLFAMICRDRRLARRDRDQLVQLFGLEKVVVPAHGRVERAVEVAISRIDGGPRPSPRLGGVGLLREAVWGHPVRNRRVGLLAEALAAGDRHAVEARFPTIAGAMADLPACPRIVVLADGLEHALALADELPGWPLVVGPDARAEGLPAHRVETLARCRWVGPGGPTQAIATLTGLGSIDLGKVDVLIRADGGAGLPSPLASITVGANDEARPLLLVDLADRHHPVLRRRGRARKDAYAAAGWPIDGIPAPDALESFLASRPKGGR